MTIGFYNVENLFDTIDNTEKEDEAFLPNAANRYNSVAYENKLHNIAHVIHNIQAAYPPYGALLLGLAEIENDTVLLDLTHQKSISMLGYQFIHFDSRDIRGIDVALLYQPKAFQVTKTYPVFVQLPSGSKRARFTRDILYVEGILLGEKVHVFVNHWPSHIGGDDITNPARDSAAMALHRHIKNIQSRDSLAKIIVMGDFNDNPDSKSIAKTLSASGSRQRSDSASLLFNPMVEKWKSGQGSLAYQDNWSLFDQILLGYPWLSKDQKGFFFRAATIFNPAYLRESSGKYANYPKRFDGKDGYSDHFPILLHFLQRTAD